MRSNFSWLRVWGIFLRYIYLFKHSFSRWLDLLYWPTVDLLLWGFITLYLQKGMPFQGEWIFQFLGALIFWNILIRAQQGLAVGFLEDIWARNLVHLFVSPLTPVEYLVGLFIYSLFKAICATLIMSLLASLVFNFNFWSQGIVLFYLVLALIIFAWSIGLITMAFVLYFGQEAEILAWALALLFLPFSAVFYPITVLPPFFQKVSQLVPASYIFENLRLLILQKTFNLSWLLKAYFITFIYFIISLLFFFWCFNLAKKEGKLTKIGE